MPRSHPLSDLVQSIHLAHPSPQGLSRFILSTFPSPTIGEPILVLYGSNDKGELHAWSSRPGKCKVCGGVATWRSAVTQTALEDSCQLDGQWEDAAEAIKAGLIHLNFDQSGDVFDEEGAGDIQVGRTPRSRGSRVARRHHHLTVQLQLHPDGKPAIHIDLHPDESGSYQSLFEAALHVSAQAGQYISWDLSASYSSQLLSRPTSSGGDACMYTIVALMNDARPQ